MERTEGAGHSTFQPESRGLSSTMYRTHARLASNNVGMKPADERGGHRDAMRYDSGLSPVAAARKETASGNEAMESPPRHLHDQQGGGRNPILFRDPDPQSSIHSSIHPSAVGKVGEKVLEKESR